MFESVLQPLEELEKWWEKPDPWNYENNLSDLNRRAMLDSVLPKKQYKRVLDIGCGDGFMTARLPGEEIIGVDVSKKAIQQAEKKNNDLKHIRFYAHSLFDLPTLQWDQSFDLILITGVLYPQYIAQGEMLAYAIIDNLLKPGGHLISCHIDEWYHSRFPYITLSRTYYSYREYSHILEVYLK